MEPRLAEATAAYRKGRLGDAIDGARAVLVAIPDHAPALNLLGLAAARAGDTATALAAHARTAALQPADAQPPYRRAMILARGDQLSAALADFDTALARQPDHVGALFNRAVTLHRLGRLDEALEGVGRLLSVRPGQAAAWTLQANVLEALGRMPEAIAAEARGVALQPGEAAAQVRLGARLGRAGDGMAALAHIGLALSAAPADPAELLARAQVLQMQRRHEEALVDLEAALPSTSEPLAVRSAQATALTALGRWAEAQECRLTLLHALDAALAATPGDAALWRLRAAVLFELDRFEEALVACEATPPGADPAQALLQRGMLLFVTEREEEALVCYAQALALRPDAARIRFDASLHRLATGDMPAAWQDHEARWQTPDFPSERREFPQPLWLGQEPIAGRRVLLHAEQGLGDTLQFCRYAALVAARGAEVLLEVQPPLAGLMRSLAGPAQVLAQGERLPAFDLHCPLVSLPLAFGTTLATIPAAPAYLSASPERQAAWARRLGPAAGRRVGLVWACNSRHGNDARRSMPLAAAVPLLRLGLEVIGLQHEVPQRDRASLSAMPGLRLLGPECRDFEDTAALVSLLDVVVTVDTAVAHLAGALGRPVCILLAQPSDWRWLLRREDSPWYPRARLFRQERRGDWDGVMTRVAAHLSAGAA